MKKSLLNLILAVFIALVVAFIVPDAVTAQEEEPCQHWVPVSVPVAPQNAQTPTSTPEPTRTPDPRPMCTPVPPTAEHLQPPFTQGVYVPEVQGKNHGSDAATLWALKQVVILLIATGIAAIFSIHPSDE